LTDELAAIDDPLARLMAATNRRQLPEDSNGWFGDYLCRLVKTYPSFTRQVVMDELPMIEGWMYYGFAIEDDAMNRFEGLRRIGKGYVGLEEQVLIDKANEVWSKENGRKT
jgi:hypothetical protein